MATEYTLAQAREMLAFPPEAMLSVDFVGPIDDEDRLFWPSPWRLLREAVRSGRVDGSPIRLRVRASSRGVNGVVTVGF